MQKYSNSELLKDNLIPFHHHQARRPVYHFMGIGQIWNGRWNGRRQATKIFRPMKGNPRKSWILDSRYWIPVFFNGTWILAPIVGGIPDSLSCTPNPRAKISQITESGFPYTGRYGHQIALCSSNCEIHLRRVWPKCRWQALEYTVCI